jgi:radical SAM superfamily enzyme YgiQ (UPF0313 family)
MLNYDYPVYRPPSEADSLILQVTLGCSFNQCSFCSMYRDKSFRMRPLERVLSEIDTIKRTRAPVRRVFLADGDALACPTGHLLSILSALTAAFPTLERVTSYALPSNLLRKSTEELQRLRQAGLAMIYYGIESGSAEILKRITKGATPDSMVRGLARAAEAGLAVSATVILGLGGRSHWREHVAGTARLVNRVPLDYLSTLQLGLESGIRDEFHRKFARLGGDFEPQDDAGMLREQRLLIETLAPPNPLVFRSNHASNALPLRGTLPADRAALLAQLDRAASGSIALRPQWLRGY